MKLTVVTVKQSTSVNLNGLQNCVLHLVLSTYLYGAFEGRFTLKRVRHMIRTYSQMHRTDKYSEHSSIIWLVWPNGSVLVDKLSGSVFESSCSHLKTSDFASALRNEFLDIQATIECGFTLKRVHDMTRTYSLKPVLCSKVFFRVIKIFIAINSPSSILNSLNIANITI